MKHSPIVRAAGAALALFTAAPGLAEDAQRSATEGVAEVRERIEARYPDFEFESVRPTPVDGIYEVVSGTDVMYLTEDARYLLRGQLIDLEARTNLTGQRRSELVHAQVESLGEESMLVYPPAEGPAQNTLTVFTDPSCPYCQQLHEDLLKMVEQYPVKVRYLMFPRAGLGSAAADTLRDIWCASDPQEAMTRAKRGQSVPGREDGCNPPIEQHFQAARSVGVNGTPFLMIGDDGPVFSGYRPTNQLLSMMGITPEEEDPAQSRSGSASDRQRAAAE